MKGRLLLGSLMISAISANTFALDIKNGKLLSHKEWTKGNITASFSETTEKNAKIDLRQVLAKKGLPGNGSEVIYALNDIQDTSGIVGQSVNFSGDNQTVIINQTIFPHTYKITNTIGTCYFGSSTECQYEYAASEDTVSVNPNSGINLMLTPHAIKAFNTAGKGWVTLDTSIQNVDSNAEFHTVKLAEFSIAYLP